MNHLSEKIRDLIESAYDDPELGMEDIIKIIQLARVEFKLDQVLIYSNRQYKYQLAHVLTCSDEGIRAHEPVSYVMTGAEYEKMLLTYSKQAALTDPVPYLMQEMGGYYLHTGILRQGVYFGSIIFWSKEKRCWSEEERYVLQKLRHLCLLFFGMNNLLKGVNDYTQAFAEFREDRLNAGFFVDMRTKETRTMKLPEGMRSVFPEWEDYDDLLNLYARKYIEGFYKDLLLEQASFAAIKKKLTKSDPVLVIEYPRVFDGQLNWIRFQVRGDDFREDGRPQIAIAAYLDITEEVKNNAYLFGANNTRHNLFTTIIALELNTEQYAVCVDNRREETKTGSFKLCGHYSQIYREVLKGNPEEAGEEQLQKLFDQQFLIRHFDEKDEMLQYDFPVRLNEQTLWVRFQIMKSSDYSPRTRKVMLFYSDITDIKNRQFLLEKENRKRKYQLEHDTLTGAYNRYGYEEILKQHKEDMRPTAYLQIDVDNFKNLNDTYGHAFGDEVLRQVAEQLTDAFRADDYVFRFGGDEFAVLLTNCKIDDWNNIGEKQRRIHIRINQVLKKGIYVTLSMGISFSKSGFDSKMIAAADIALYQAKSNGRAGCCILDDDHKVVYAWKDDIGSSTEGNVLDQSDTGAYRIELPAGDLAQGRLICNETTRVLLGFTPSMSPEECFKSWLGRVDPYSRESLTETRKAMMEKGQAEFTYIYHHPQLGEIMVRSGGRCLNNEDGIVFYGYHQSLQNTRIVLHEDDSQRMIDALLSLYFASYYVDLEQNSFFTLKSTEESRHLEKQAVSATTAIEDYVNTLIRPEYRQVMARFMDLGTLAERLRDRAFVEAEYESMVEDKGWCRVRIFAVRRDEAGEATHIQILVASIDQEKKKLEEARE